MEIITVYLETENERKKKSRMRHGVAFIAALVAVALVSDRPLQKVEAAAAPPEVRIVKVYVDRPVWQYETPIGPTRPATPTPPIAPPAVTPRTEIPPPTRTTPVTPRLTKPAELPPAASSPIPLQSLVIEPPAIDFSKGREQQVAIFNPNSRPILITRIVLESASGSVRGFALSEQERCERVLAANERCRFRVVASRWRRSNPRDLRIHAEGTPAD